MVHLRLEGITKRFGSFVANDSISLEVQSGEIHAILGENGAGKTTLMNVLSGLYQPDSGQIHLEGVPVHLTSANDAIQHGIGMIHQHFMLVPQLSVAENIVLGTEFGLRLNLRQKMEQVRSMSNRYRLQVDPSAIVGDLSVGMQQRVEILKVLYRGARVLILDEPTAVLTPLEVESLFIILRQLAAAGHTILFISHKLDELLNLCDKVTVLRQGQVVETLPIQSVTKEILAQLMVGRKVLFSLDKGIPNPGSTILDVQNLYVKDDRHLPAIEGVTFQLRTGEILGIAGVDGNGQRELADAIAGLRSVAEGKICLEGIDITEWSVRQRIQQLHIGYIPEDRQRIGLVMNLSIAKNLILKAFKQLPFCKNWLLQDSIIDAHAIHAIKQFDVRAIDEQVSVSNLSGGNQQKVILARELSGHPKLIIAMQPCRGLDVGATEYVQKQLLIERQRGAAILYISTELEEVMTMSDRIAVMYRGQFMDILDAAHATIETVGVLMMGEKVSKVLDTIPATTST
ncbi:MAG: ABC transporter ATP-binding protein [Drouetiella hepatica Uher 2000/2452]|jgi:simple sugar transport system ATP-binding protein|uniref:ABC transporter ATP-binding protein n=1 Tax=Drouetiella hepatica Uher 2000/2452 TaxID=904376 RepID=A0A951QER6_9CYAN|nr:ABC transporter ATP-binding protein [Drouetiella hepatica Uher 2000/2452]